MSYCITTTTGVCNVRKEKYFTRFEGSRGDLSEKWTNYKSNMKLVNPANKRKFNVIVVGTGLAGASASATLSELGYNVKAFTFHDTPRRAHSIAAQGGINAAKNYQNDGDSIHRFFTILSRVEILDHAKLTHTDLLKWVLT